MVICMRLKKMAQASLGTNEMTCSSLQDAHSHQKVMLFPLFFMREEQCDKSPNDKAETRNEVKKWIKRFLAD